MREAIWMREVGKRPILPPGWQSEDRPLVLADRTYGALVKAVAEGIYLPTATVRQVFQHMRSNPVDFLDLLTSVESWGPDYELLLKRDGVVLAADFLQLLNGISLPPRDPRLAPSLRCMYASLSTSLLGLEPMQAVQMVEQAPELILRPQGFVSAISSLEDAVSSCLNSTVEEELTRWVTAAIPSARDVRVVLAREGWSGSEPETLQAVSDTEGVTRERIRQISAKTASQLREATSAVFMPSLERAFDLIQQMVPCSREAAESRLVEMGLARDRFPIPSLIRAADALGRKMPIELVTVRGSEWIRSPGDTQVHQQLGLVLHEARVACGGSGALTVNDLRETIAQKRGELLSANEIRSVLEASPEVVWLDDHKVWFSVRAKPGRNRLENLVNKCLSVCGSLPISELRDAAARNRRLAMEPPPSPILACFCSRVCNLKVDGDLVTSPHGASWRDVLNGDELAIVEILFELGPVCHIDTLWPEAHSRGLGRISFWVTLSNSPTVVRYSRGIYGLRGIDVPTSLLSDLLTRRTNVREVLRTYSQISEDRAFAVYRLSSAAVRLGAVSWPSPLRDEFEGDFSVSCAHPSGTVNQVVTLTQQATGLREVMQLAEVGQHLLLALDKDDRRGFALLGDVAMESLGDDEVDQLLDSLPVEDAPAQTTSSRVETECDQPPRKPTELGEQILSLLEKNPSGLRAREIASILSMRSGVPVDRHEINRALYGALHDRVRKIDGYSWCVR